ncbi:MAG: TSUP family transporter [Cyclobacteriaceae bacterium]|nr:TSUP family transporter [Cyclobacteriaceae bacterium]
MIAKTVSPKESNTLFPVFLKLEKMKLLIVGGGKVALEKLNVVLSNSPATEIKLIAITICSEVKQLATENPSIQLVERAVQVDDLHWPDLVMIAVNDRAVSEWMSREAKKNNKLANVADTPDLCDFYLSSVVKRGHLKIAISTNGKSPTIGKRMKEIFTNALPEEIDSVLENMSIIRGKLNGNLAEKIIRLNEITRMLSDEGGDTRKMTEKKWKRVASYFLSAFFFMFLGHLVLSFIPLNDVLSGLIKMGKDIDSNFYWMIAAGFVAQLVDGALGMGYGVTSTTILLSLGINLPAISGSVHTAEMFSSGVSGYSHFKFGNVNKKLFKTLLIPGVLGAIFGAYLLSTLGNQYANYIRPILAMYTLFLGIKIIRNIFRKNAPSKVKRVGWLAGAGGFLDSFGGGGWGPLVTSSLIAKGRSPRYVIGSVSITEFFVTLASAATFFALLGVSHWPVILGLIIGGTLAAPFAARMVGKLPLKTMFLSVGTLVIIWSLRILWKSLL